MSTQVSIICISVSFVVFLTVCNILWWKSIQLFYNLHDINHKTLCKISKNRHLLGNLRHWISRHNPPKPPQHLWHLKLVAVAPVFQAKCHHQHSLISFDIIVNLPMFSSPSFNTIALSWQFCITFRYPSKPNPINWSYWAMILLDPKI